MHYSTSGDAVACGRAGNNLTSTSTPDQVSCKSCQRSLVKTESPASAKKSTPSLAELRKQRMAKASPAPSTFCFKANWRARLSALPGSSRLPRGVAPQRFV
ncbi:hypothetical protein ACIOVF_27865 [Pseudomonas sp. NPDC087612]|nr:MULTISPECIES: hypothetical protein [Pseudomonas]KJK19747.1 hypothetical protein UB48_08155 [Pseudomonas sp. 2(2015)]QVM97942.1 hypothetical protein JYG36_07100 [Pseudomonas sp. SORT22]UVL55180.1 hypothetical protein LOY22_20350 [Pseudomonas sp. B21-035]UVL60467.1 hypothetical protein LOY54_20895 [Pseudomonas sp. B21-032]SDQ46312.1 hypothetical protein SAMN05216487_1959 [Pseudomonas sp. UC 17F4]